jgi:hypothetical protein
MERVRNYHSVQFKIRMAVRQLRRRAVIALLRMLETDSPRAV